MSARALAIVVVAACSGVDSDPNADGVAWIDQSASLTAESFTAVVEGVTFHGVAETTIDPDNGDKLEVSWDENGYHQRFIVNFQLSGDTWIATQVRIYNLAGTDWHSAVGSFFSAPLGGAFRGDFELVLNDQASVRFTNATVTAYGL